MKLLNTVYKRARSELKSNVAIWLRKLFGLRAVQYIWSINPLTLTAVRPGSAVICNFWHCDAQPWATECPDVKNYKWPA